MIIQKREILLILELALGSEEKRKFPKVKSQNVHKSNLRTSKVRSRGRIFLSGFVLTEEQDLKHLSNKTVRKEPSQQKKLFHHESKHNESSRWKEKIRYQKVPYSAKK
jgi:hypothetical protein